MAAVFAVTLLIIYKLVRLSEENLFTKRFYENPQDISRNIQNTKYFHSLEA